jgi:DNA replication protein DnaC
MQSELIKEKMAGLNFIGMRRAFESTLATGQRQNYTYEQDRELDKNQILRLAECEYIDRKENINITGPTGVGKSFIASALGNRACIAGYKAMVTNMAKLIAKLKMVNADGSFLEIIGEKTIADAILDRGIYSYACFIKSTTKFWFLMAPE